MELLVCVESLRLILRTITFIGLCRDCKVYFEGKKFTGLCRDFKVYFEDTNSYWFV
jgi:hypothetical protein